MNLVKTPCILAVSALLLIPDTGRSCGFEVWSEEYRYHLLFPAIQPDEALLPFHFSSALFYQNATDFQDLAEWKNCREWSQVSGRKADTLLWHEVLYDRTYAELLILNDGPAFDLLRRLTPEAREVLLFIKKIEAHKESYTPWHSEQGAHNDQRAKYLEESKVLYGRLISGAMKCRIAYQILRLSWGNEFENNRKKYMVPVQEQSLVGNWSLREYAGRTGDAALSNVILAELFLRCDEWKKYAFESFDRKKVNEALKIAPNKEIAAGIRMLGLLKQSLPSLGALKSFYAENPGFAYMDMLVLREINKMEDQLYTVEYTKIDVPAIYGWYWRHEDVLYRRRDALRHQKELSDFVWKETNGAKGKSAFWNLSSAYLALLDKRQDMTAHYLKKTRGCKDFHKGIAFQYHILETLYLVGVETPNEKQIAQSFNKVVAIVKDHPAQRSILSNFGLVLGNRLHKKGNRLLAAMAYSWCEHYHSGRFVDHYCGGWTDNNGWCDWKENPGNMQGSMQMFFYLEKEVKTADIHSISNWIKSPRSKEMGAFGIKLVQNQHRVSDLLGTRYFLEKKYMDALTAFNSIPDPWWDTCKWDIYSYINASAFKDPLSYIKSPVADPKVTSVNKCIVLDSLCNWDKQSQGRGEAAALAQFKKANLLFSAGNSGGAWALSRYWQYIYDEPGTYGYTYEAGVEKKLDRNYFDGEDAREAYLKAYAMSNNALLRGSALAHAAYLENELPDFKTIIRDMRRGLTSSKASPSLRKLFNEYPGMVHDIYRECPGVNEYFLIIR